MKKGIVISAVVVLVLVICYLIYKSTLAKHEVEKGFGLKVTNPGDKKKQQSPTNVLENVIKRTVTRG